MWQNIATHYFVVQMGQFSLRDFPPALLLLLLLQAGDLVHQKLAREDQRVQAPARHRYPLLPAALQRSTLVGKGGAIAGGCPEDRLGGEKTGRSPTFVGLEGSWHKEKGFFFKGKVWSWQVCGLFWTKKYFLNRCFIKMLGITFFFKYFFEICKVSMIFFKWSLSGCLI